MTESPLVDPGPVPGLTVDPEPDDVEPAEVVVDAPVVEAVPVSAPAQVHVRDEHGSERVVPQGDGPNTWHRPEDCPETVTP